MRRSRLAAPVAVLLSGGLDSAILLHDLSLRHRSVQPIYVRAGMHWERAELRALRRFLRALEAPRIRALGARRIQPLIVLDVPMADLYGRHWSTTGRGAPGYRASNESVYLPGRNLALLTKAATFCVLRGIRLLASGLLDSNPFPDATPAFLAALQTTLRRGLGAPIRILAPYRARTKEEVVRRGAGLPLHLTLSCAQPVRGRHCGRCTKCAERVRAFRRAGRVDPTVYAGGPGAAASSRGVAGRGAAVLVRTTRMAPYRATSVR